MLNVTIICVGALKDACLREAAAEYEKRLGAFCRLKTVETENGKIPSLLSPKAYKIALCVEGGQMSSEEFSETIEKAAAGGKSEIQFVIGGFDGLEESVKKMCDLRLSFSKMTFPHRLMRVILLEQIYRAFTIAGNLNYHH